MMRRFLFVSLVVLLGAAGCSKPGGSDAPAPGSQQQAAAREEASASDKLKFKDADDRERFSLKQKEDGAKLVDGEDKELARYKWKGTALKVSGPDDAVLGYVVGSAGGALTLRDAEQRQILFTLARQGPGWRLNDAKGALLYSVSPDDEGADIQDASGTAVARVKVREGKVSLRDAGGRTLLATKSLVRADAAACLAFERLDLPQRVALLFVLQSMDR
ncbi:hypothetical protein HPC49_14840 [Pyxidicoccus fallax]|uniref:Lipoprotein n=1 Tax=Pyxidicoccus fallax TaxID=394095 RepID=A0A848LJZ8_9BACT|nr:hypothetical protein [Pyxidicoccus fallax]NMO18004.1 hypothetical protein [Pyxidicoccus fallax]NPC79509.1 hypothetical protein [Pyxidicoccus fallax]